MGKARRVFLRSLAAVPLVPGALAATSTARTAGPSASPLPELDPAADALTDVVRHRYGRHIEPAELDEIREGIRSNLDAARLLRERLALTNADEPVTVFAARAPRPGAAAGRGK